MIDDGLKEASASGSYALKDEPMDWVNEAFAQLERERHAKEVKGIEKGEKVDETVQGEAWSALVSSIFHDLDVFNHHKDRIGNSPIVMYQRYFACEVRRGGAQYKRLVLTLGDSGLQVTVHPDFPKQFFEIAIEARQGKRPLWVLGDKSKAHAKLSAQQLSEYLLKPIFFKQENRNYVNYLSEVIENISTPPKLSMEGIDIASKAN